MPARGQRDARRDLRRLQGGHPGEVADACPGVGGWACPTMTWVAGVGGLACRMPTWAAPWVTGPPRGRGHQEGQREGRWQREVRWRHEPQGVRRRGAGRRRPRWAGPGGHHHWRSPPDVWLPGLRHRLVEPPLGLELRGVPPVQAQPVQAQALGAPGRKQALRPSATPPSSPEPSLWGPPWRGPPWREPSWREPSWLPSWAPRAAAGGSGPQPLPGGGRGQPALPPGRRNGSSRHNSANRKDPGTPCW